VSQRKLTFLYRLRFHERIKRVVGLNVDIDLEFAEQNPKPSPEFLKESVITEATVSFATTLENEVSMPFSVDYAPKSGKAGARLTEMFKTEAKLLQICGNCLSRAKTDEHIIIADRSACECFCNACWSQQCKANRKGFLRSGMQSVHKVFRGR